MSINLALIPINFLVPGVYVEIDNKNASGAPPQRKPVLAIGTRLSTGTIAQGIVKPITSASMAREYFGRGSMLAEMCATFLAANPYAELIAVALDEDAAGVKATKTVTVTGTATEDGTIAFLWGGRKIRVGVTKGDVQNTIATNIKAAVDLELDQPTVASRVNNVVTATCRWKGATGNDISIVHSYYVGEKLPAGVSIAIADGASGTTDPDVADAIAALGGDTQYYTVIMPYTDDGNMDTLEAELESRWGPMRAIPGQAIAAYRADFTDTQTYGNTRNSPFSSVLGTGESPTPPWLWAASVAANEVAENDPAVPRQNTKLLGVLPPQYDVDQFTLAERQLLLLDGIATYKVVAGQPYLERLRTTYQTNAGGEEDPSYRDIETMRNLADIRYQVAYLFTSKYPQAKLGNDGENFDPGQVVMTPKLARGEIIGLFESLNRKARVEDLDAFKKALLVERDPDNKDRLLAFIPPDLVNQFRSAGMQISYKL